MKHFFDHWEVYHETITKKNLILFLDFDGTLTPIAETPQEAVLAKEGKAVLEQLVKLSGCQVVIISGRELDDLKSKVGVKGVTYIGNHGLEIDGPLIQFESLATPEMKETLRLLAEVLHRKLDKISGIVIEDKGLSISVHYRMVQDRDVTAVRKIFNDVSHLYFTHKKIKVGEGKKILEIKLPVEWDKGKAIQWVLKKEKDVANGMAFPICLGDDTTDEDAFEALQNFGLPILIGTPRESRAHYFLADDKEVFVFLQKIIAIKTKDTTCQMS